MSSVSLFRNWLTKQELSVNDEPYLTRYCLLALPGGRRLYLHHFTGDDWSRDPHDHPKTFWSIGLRGCYDEDVYQAQAVGRIQRVDSAGFHWDRQAVFQRRVRWTAPWFRKFPAEHIHNIHMVDGGTAWTLVWTGKESRMWGFWEDSKRWVDFRTYILKHMPGSS